MSAREDWQLVQATHPEMATRWRHHYHAWGSGMPLELYLRREEELNREEFCKKAMRLWLLKDGDGEVLASCETYRARFWYAEAEGELHGLHLETVASVLVEPRLRGRGHALALLHNLSERLAFEGVAGAALYSDVGTALYRRAGYLLHPARQSVRRVAAEIWPEGVTDVGVGAVADLLQEEARFVHGRLASTSAPTVVEVPSPEAICWFHTRSRFRAFARGQEPSPNLGAQATDGGYMLWTADAPERALHVLVWRPRTADDARRLAQAACAEAREQGLEQVIWWDADRDTGLDVFRAPDLQPPGAVATVRESSLPMLAWFTPHGDAAARPFPLVWSAIERFGWR